MSAESKTLTYATAFLTVSAGFLLLSSIPSVAGIRQVQKAQKFNLMADGYRMMSLAKTYDAKAAVESLKMITSELV